MSSSSCNIENAAHCSALQPKFPSAENDPFEKSPQQKIPFGELSRSKRLSLIALSLV
ncbi:unnamed protein product [Mycena citricolor]|uniref:Uncharacterized protein n=1 Tax=Mycena citricolor TaxID=2018698 RepID=A0AAD2HJS6_9AGAR|nr:unnamed protein product [Mycena citricolor]